MIEPNFVTSEARGHDGYLVVMKTSFEIYYGLSSRLLPPGRPGDTQPSAKRTTTVPRRPCKTILHAVCFRRSKHLGSQVAVTHRVILSVQGTSSNSSKTSMMLSDLSPGAGTGCSAEYKIFPRNCTTVRCRIKTEYLVLYFLRM